MQDRTIYIHEGRNSEKVVRQIKLSELRKDFQDAVNSQIIWGFYLSEDGDIVAEDIWEGIHENILKKV